MRSATLAEFLQVDPVELLITLLAFSSAVRQIPSLPNIPLLGYGTLNLSIH